MKTLRIALDWIRHGRKSLLCGILVGGLLTPNLFSPVLEGVKPVKFFAPTHQAELRKLFNLLQLYMQRDLKIVFNGNTYKMEKAVKRAKKFLLSSYRGEKAESWIKTHLYRSPDKGKVIYLAFPDGSRRPLKDVLIEDLKHLPQS